MELRRTGRTNSDESHLARRQTEQMLPNARFAIRGHQIAAVLLIPRTIAALLVQGHIVKIGRLCEQPQIPRFMFGGEGRHLETQPNGMAQIPTVQRRFKSGCRSFRWNGADCLWFQVPAFIIQSVHGDVPTQLPTGLRFQRLCRYA